MRYWVGLKSRRKVALLCALFLLVVSFSACISIFYSKKFSTDNTKDGSSTPAEMKTVSLSLFSDAQDWTAPEWSMEDGSLTACISEKTGVRIDTECPAQDADMQLSLMLMENKLPDIIAVSDQNMIRQLVSSGKVWNLEEFFSEYNPDAKILQMFSQEEKSAMTYRDGGWYAIPIGYGTSDIQESGNAILWNTNALAALGYSLDDVGTESGVLEVLEAAYREKEQEQGDRIPLLMDGTDASSGGLKFLAESFGASPLDANGNYQDIWTTEGGKEAIAFTNQLLQKGILDAASLSYSKTEIQSQLKQQNVLCFIGDVSGFVLDSSCWANGGLIQANSGAMPVVEEQTVGGYGWTNLFVSTSCTDLEDTAVWLDYMIRGALLDDAKNTEEIQSWWLFRNPCWETFWDGMDSEAEVLETNLDYRTYDAKLFVVPNRSFQQDENLEQVGNALAEYKESELTYLLAAKSKEEFSQRYEEFLKGMNDIGYSTYRDAMSEQMQENREFFAGGDGNA